MFGEEVFHFEEAAEALALGKSPTRTVLSRLRRHSIVHVFLGGRSYRLLDPET
ncbi:MAG: hypothetical protein ACUVQ0_06405 [Thermoproteota archaeon]